MAAPALVSLAVPGSNLAGSGAIYPNQMEAIRWGRTEQGEATRWIRTKKRY